MAAVALTTYERAPKNVAKVESFGASVERTRVRLTDAESEGVRYVWQQWDADAGLKSSMQAQAERLAASPHLLAEMRRTRAEERRAARASKEYKTWRHAWATDIGCHTMGVGAGDGGYRGANSYYASERFVDLMLEPAGRGIRYTELGKQVHLAWSALRAMASARAPSLVILHALYGERGPGLLSGAGDYWPKPVNRDYVRVVRFVDGVGLIAELEAALLVDKRKRKTESDEARKARLVAAEAERWALLYRLGEGCEQLIEKATVDYREARRLVTP